MHVCLTPRALKEARAVCSSTSQTLVAACTCSIAVCGFCSVHTKLPLLPPRPDPLALVANLASCKYALLRDVAGQMGYSVQEGADEVGCHEGGEGGVASNEGWIGTR